MQWNYNKYRGLENKPGEARREENAESVDRHALLEKDLLWGQVGDAGDVTKEVLDATRLIFTAVGHDVPISEKGYLDLLRGLSDKVQKAQRKTDATTRQLSEKERKIGEM